MVKKVTDIKDVDEDIQKQIVVDIEKDEFLEPFKDERGNLFFRGFRDTDKYKIIEESKGLSKEEIRKTFPEGLKNCLIKNDVANYKRIDTWFRIWQEKGYGAFFIPNGGHTDSSITKIRSFFQDLDFGKAWDGTYEINLIKGKEIKKKHYVKRTLEEINKLKSIAIKILKESPIAPSIVNRTCNGYHVYWLVNINSEQNVDEFIVIQEVLIDYFNKEFTKLYKGKYYEFEQIYADKQVKNISRLLRIPGYWHQKKPENPVKIVCILFNKNLKYTQKQIVDAFNVNLVAPKIKEKELFHQQKITVVPKQYTEKEKLYKVNIDELILKNNKSKFSRVIAQTAEENIHMLKIQSINQFLIDLGIMNNIVDFKEKFHCPFHSDNNSSANFVINNYSEQRYICYGDECIFTTPRFKGVDIIDIVQILFNLDFIDAIKWLNKYFNINYNPDEWALRQIQKFDNNIMILNTDTGNRMLQEKAPMLYKILSNKTLMIFECLNLWGKYHVKDNRYSFNGSSCFYYARAQIRKYFTRRGIKCSLSYITNCIVLLATLGLIVKVKSCEAPELLLNATNDYITKKKSENGYDYDFGFYIINAITDIKVLKIAEERAIILKKRGLSIRAINRNYIESVFGEEFAGDMYFTPETKIYEETITYDIESQVKQLISKKIQKHGYCMFKNIEKVFIKKYTVINKYYTNKRIDYYVTTDEKRIAFKRAINKLITEDKRLKYGVFNKNIKEKLNIKFSNYRAAIIYSEKN